MNFGQTPISKEKILINTKYLYINSANRDEGSESEFTIYFPNSLFVNNSNNKKFMRISLYSLNICREWYNIMNNVNNILQYSPDGITSSFITIPEGSYSVYELMTALNTLLTGMTITYSLITNKYTFTPVNSNAYIVPSTCGSFLGLQNGISYTGTFTSTNPINMLYESDIYINTNMSSGSYNLDNVNNLNIQSSTIIDKIPINAPPFANIIFNANELHASLEIPLIAHLTSARFWITTNRLRKITNLKQPWNMTLKMEIYEE